LTFVFTLRPRLFVFAVVIVVLLPVCALGRQSEAGGRGEAEAIRVLLVEDDDRLARLTKKYLELRGLVVAIAPDGDADSDQDRDSEAAAPPECELSRCGGHEGQRLPRP
jgi:hypothetical protein